MPEDNGPEMDAFSDRISQAIGEAIRAKEISDDGRGMPSSYVLIATYIDGEGKTCTAFGTNNGAKVHETLGLLSMGQAVYEDEARAWVQGL